jgi:hypothetical protein
MLKNFSKDSSVGHEDEQRNIDTPILYKEHHTRGLRGTGPPSL